MNIPNRCLELAATATTGFLDLLFPAACSGCGRWGVVWCRQCAGELGGLRRVVRPLLPREPPVFALGRYTGAARRAVIAYKETGRRALAQPFGKALATGLNGIGGTDPSWCVVPAPSRVSSSRRRGGAHMARVAACMASESAAPTTVADCLVLREGVRDSVGLDPEDRLRNVAGRVRVHRRPEVTGTVVLIDDVITTGATVACSLEALAGVGIEVAVVVGLTATQ